ncbi:unnamed protein product [Pneumocystis jirovecii]|uniref:Uncharacterized protein n=2 Tax=Pneumocystis jirovecii TaxID=42068 RepID=L0P9P9_PNEJI|nr:uncharacterized protein T551_00975 [Pneumocystis jirovecii RU7]KTW31714.1 hypothetical protein T551_00975 [Pneumocystis jirovecii RU7]CCJ28922.1 unnamed protein product [Pneumocystis jirovecii]
MKKAGIHEKVEKNRLKNVKEIDDSSIQMITSKNKRNMYCTSDSKVSAMLPLKSCSEFQKINSNLNIKSNHSEQYLKENLLYEVEPKSNDLVKKNNFFHHSGFQLQKNPQKHFFTETNTLSQFQETDILSGKQQFPKFFHANDGFMSQDNHFLQDTNLPISLKSPRLISKNNSVQSLTISENKTPLSSPYTSPKKKHVENLENFSNIAYINDMMSLNVLQKSPKCTLYKQNSPKFTPKTLKTESRLVLTEVSDNTKFARTNRKILDLEISNTSLLALNDNLEKQTRRQMSEIKELRKKIITENLYITNSTSNSALSSDESESDSKLSQTSDSSITDHQRIIDNSLSFMKSLRRVLRLTKNLIKEGHQALRSPKNDIPIYLKVLNKNTDLQEINYKNETNFENS